MTFIQAAISPATRASYRRPQERYIAFIEARDDDTGALPVTVERLTAWLSHEAVGEGRSKPLSARSIGVYRSAISTLHEESAYNHLPNPAQHPVVTRFMKGVVRVKRKEENVERATTSASDSIELTPAIIREIEPHATQDIDQRDMPKWAAACMGVFGLLRPNEFLGSPAHPERRMRVSQIKFHTRSGIEVPVPAAGSPAAADAPPHHFAIALGGTKADPLGTNPDHIVAARPAVVSLWRWMIERAAADRRSVALGFESDPWLFNLPRDRTLTLPSLVRFLQDWLEAMGHGRPKIAGRAFRRGGASGMVAAGASRPDTMAAGRWRSAAMVDVYTNRAAKRQALITASERLGRP
jgi:hypothetical protein